MDRHQLPMKGKTNERGATLIIVAASLLFMFGLAAIVVDGGLGFSERRRAQSGADFGALAAVQFSNFDDLSTLCPSTMSAVDRAACRGAVEAKTVVDGNLGRVLDWNDWASCEDAEALDLTSEVDYSGTGAVEIECLSFSETTQDARVKAPTLDVATTFGRVLGFDVLNVGAFAEVHASLPDASRILPFALPAGAGAFECLKASSHPDWGVCGSGGDTGKYGYLDIPTYGNPDLGTSDSNCNATNNVLLSNMIRGVDHGLGSHSSGSPTGTDPALRDDDGPDTATRINVCPVFDSNANEVNVQPGVAQSVIEQGMTYGFSSSSRGPMWGGTQWRSGNAGNPAIDLDDTPLWSYLTSTSFCPSGAPSSTQDMVECLEAWTPSDGVVFSNGITSNGRYSFAPRLWTDFSSAGWYLIQRIEPIYVNTSYWGCNASGDCEGIHAPGDAPSPISACVPPPSPYTGNEPADFTCADSLPLDKSVNLSSVTSFNLERGMLPDSALSPFPADGPLVDLALTR